jgi:conjugal transfer pilus assembly protein TraF
MFFLLAPLSLGATVGNHAWYQGKAEGWFWKERIPDQASPQPKPITPPAPNPPDPSPPEDQPLTAAWYRKHLGDIRDRALDDPSPENVRSFFLIQKTLLDKAETFADAARDVVLSDPLLDERPSRTPSLSLAEAAGESERLKRLQGLKALSGKAGLLFVYRSDCRYCHAMAPLLDALSRKTGLHLIALSLDGVPLQGLSTAIHRIAPDLAERLSVTVTPMLYLMKPPHRLETILEGAASEIELEERILAAGHRLGLLDAWPEGNHQKHNVRHQEQAQIRQRVLEDLEPSP